MKKIFMLCTAALMLASCGGGDKKEAGSKTDEPVAEKKDDAHLS